jgi:hypothetical protein
VELQYNLKLKMAQKNINVVRKKISHTIEGHKQFIIRNMQGIEHSSCKAKLCHMMITSTITNVNSHFQLARKSNSKLNQHKWIVLCVTFVFG